MSNQSGLILLLHRNRGDYVPVHFAQIFDRQVWGLTKRDLKPLMKGPEDACYWKMWHKVLDKAKCIDEQGFVWTLYHDGDLCAVCPELMSSEEYINFFGGPRPCMC